MQPFPQDLFEYACVLTSNAYAPYSGFHVACVIRTKKGTIHRGVNVENVSYSLTSCAEKSAVAGMVSAGEQEIAEVLVLGPGPSVCPPCGACRQILKEFADDRCLVTLTTPDGTYSQYRLGTLLPGAFSENLLPNREFSVPKESELVDA